MIAPGFVPETVVLPIRILTLERDFDSASRAFDAPRRRTHDKDEQTLLSIALGDLATIKVR